MKSTKQLLQGPGLTYGQMNGYEIRAKILELAQTQAFQPFMTNPELIAHGETKFPDAEAVLAIAEKFNEFVSGKAK